MNWIHKHNDLFIVGHSLHGILTAEMDQNQNIPNTGNHLSNTSLLWPQTFVTHSILVKQIMEAYSIDYRHQTYMTVHKCYSKYRVFAISKTI